MVNDLRRKTYCSFPRFLLFRQRPSYGIWKTEENGARKGHAEQEAMPSLSALMSWPVVISPSISAIRPPLDVA